MKARLVISAALALSACSAEEKRADNISDRQAIAMAKEMSEPPAMPIEAEAISRNDMSALNLPTGGCRFVLPSSAEPVLYAQAKKGWIKLDGKLVELASDRSSLPFPDGAWSKYIGLANWLTVSTRESGQPGAGEIVIHESRDRVVYRARGTLECGA